jgi:hypothetical protein
VLSRRRSARAAEMILSFHSSPFLGRVWPTNQTSEIRLGRVIGAAEKKFITGLSPPAGFRYIEYQYEYF